MKKNTININLYFTHDYFSSDLELKDKNVVVIDVLRTTTTMITALANGAKEIIPTNDVATAGMIARNSEGQSLLCGERNGKIIPGFNLGNSVKEYSIAAVSGKTLIFCSTNGTPAIIKSKFTKNCVIAAFANIKRVTEHLAGLRQDLIVLCAGKTNEFSLEDTVCAGMLITRLISENTKDEYKVTDSALGATKLYALYKKELLNMLKECEHGKFLIELGFEDDLFACSQVDVFNYLPVYRNGVIKLIESFESDPKLTMKKVAQKS